MFEHEFLSPPNSNVTACSIPRWHLKSRSGFCIGLPVLLPVPVGRCFVQVGQPVPIPVKVPVKELNPERDLRCHLGMEHALFSIKNLKLSMTLLSIYM